MLEEAELRQKIHGRHSFLIVLFVVTCVIGHNWEAWADANAAPEDLPSRLEGMWRISTLSADIGLQVNEVCVRANDRIIGEARVGCLRPQVARHEDQTIVTTVCGLDGEVTTTSLLLTGDFRSWYRVQGKITSKSPGGGVDVHAGFTISANYLRPGCQAAGAPQ